MSAESADPHQCTAIDRQRHTSDEIGFIGSEEQLRLLRPRPFPRGRATEPWRTLRSNADPDIVVQDIDATGSKRLLLGQIGGKGFAFTTLLRRHRGGLLGGDNHPVDGILAPSCAKRSGVARPLPTPSPAL
jgi:hypothetical protein